MKDSKPFLKTSSKMVKTILFIYSEGDLTSYSINSFSSRATDVNYIA